MVQIGITREVQRIVQTGMMIEVDTRYTGKVIMRVPKSIGNREFWE